MKTTEFHQLTTYEFAPNYTLPPAEEVKYALQHVMFQPIDQPDFMEHGYGLTAFNDFMNFSPLALEDCVVADEYILFGFRVDRRTAPAGAVERRHREKIDEWLDGQAKILPKQAALPGTGVEPRIVGETPKIRKETRRELRVKARMELIKIAPPNPKHVPCVIDMTRGRIYVGSTSTPILRALESLVCRALQTYLIPLDPRMRLGLANYTPVAENFTPGMSFLTWLWRRIVTYIEQDKPMQLDSPVSREPDQVRITATGVTLEQSENGQKERLTANGRHAGTWEEIETAVRQGRSVVGLGLVLKSFDDVYAIEVSHLGLSFKQLKLPKIPKASAEDEDYGELIIRMAQIRTITGYIDDLWSIWIAQLIEDGKLKRKSAEEDDLPVGFGRITALAKDHGDLFGDIASSGFDRDSGLFRVPTEEAVETDDHTEPESVEGAAA